MINERNYTLMCDFYELTMANGYYLAGKANQICYFDVFYRTTPDFGGYAIDRKSTRLNSSHQV